MKIVSLQGIDELNTFAQQANVALLNRLRAEGVISREQHEEANTYCTMLLTHENLIDHLKRLIGLDISPDTNSKLVCAKLADRPADAGRKDNQ